MATKCPQADWLLVPDLQLQDAQRLQAVNAILRPLRCTDDQYERVGEVFRRQLADALCDRPSSLQMENTYIPELPDGSENGVYLALDLGGTNFRTILLELRDGRVVRELVRPYHIADEMRVGAGVDLFDYLAACLVDFVDSLGLAETPLQLGFTFSFPMHQHSLDAGDLVTWTKSFNCAEVQGRDVVRLLREALARRGHNHIEVMAILNDTTGTLVQGASMDGRTRVGIVMGTGTNACYLERADRVQHWETERHGERRVIIDIEWGAFGDDGALDFVRTEFDRQLDARSVLPRSFTFEKYIGGQYLGELVRGILARLHRDGVFLVGTAAAAFPEPWTFGSHLMSEVEKDIVAAGRQRTDAILLEQLGAVDAAAAVAADAAILQHVVAIVGLRAARLVAATTAVLLQQIGNPTTAAAAEDETAATATADVDAVTVIAVDGSVYKHHPRLKGWLERYIGLAESEHKFELMLAEDGSGKGAGLVAAIAARLRTRC